MESSVTRRPSPAIVVAILALVAALAGTAIAGTNVLTKPVSKKVVKKIATKQVKKLAPGLAVASANTAGHAGAADTAGRANVADTAGDANALGGQPPGAYALSDNPPFREVGAPGEPLFESNCQNHPATGFSTAAFYKDSTGIVHLKGLVACPATGVQTAFTLPPGYRPSQAALMPIYGPSGYAIESFILTGGEVRINCGAGGSCVQGLDGFTFRP